MMLTQLYTLFVIAAATLSLRTTFFALTHPHEEDTAMSKDDEWKAPPALGLSQASLRFLSRDKSESQQETPKASSSLASSSSLDHHSWETPEPEQVTIFYNIYIPPEDEAKQAQALAIVQEQLDTFGLSPIMTETNKKVVFYYNSIGGGPATLTQLNQKMKENCHRHKWTCIHLQHYSKPDTFEDVTLNKMHDFCLSHVAKTNNNHNLPNSKQHVAYLHNKGSYHYSEQNNVWRRSLTRAVAHPDCWYPAAKHSSSCNVCGLQFQPLWVQFFPGNFFTADCDYIAKLLPLDDYARQQEMLAQISQEKYHFQSGMYDETLRSQDDFWGIGRFAREHWIGSHPDLSPCDLSNTGDFCHWLHHHDPVESNFTWGMTPRHAVESTAWAGLKNTTELVKTMKRPLHRKREYTFLAGSLHRWIGLYNQVPPDSSWVWSFYPDGGFWKQGLRISGMSQVIQETLRKIDASMEKLLATREERRQRRALKKRQEQRT